MSSDTGDFQVPKGATRGWFTICRTLPFATIKLSHRVSLKLLYAKFDTPRTCCLQWHLSLPKSIRPLPTQVAAPSGHPRLRWNEGLHLPLVLLFDTRTLRDISFGSFRVFRVNFDKFGKIHQLVLQAPRKGDDVRQSARVTTVRLSE